MSVCHQHLSSCSIYLRAPSLFCQEPLFSSTGPSLFNLPRDSFAALKSLQGIFCQYALSFLQQLKLSQGLFSNLAGASLQKNRASSVQSAKRFSFAALKSLQGIVCQSSISLSPAAKLSQGLRSNMPGASTQQLRATPVSSAKRLSSQQSLLMQDL